MIGEFFKKNAKNLLFFFAVQIENTKMNILQKEGWNGKQSFYFIF